MARTSLNKPSKRQQKINIIVEESSTPIQLKTLEKKESKSYPELITDALTDINHPVGLPTHIIKNHMLTNLPTNKELGSNVLHAVLQQMITKGDIIMTRQRGQKWYKISPTKAVSQKDAATDSAARGDTKKQNKEETEAAEKEKRRRKRKQRPTLKKRMMNGF